MNPDLGCSVFRFPLSEHHDCIDSTPVFSGVCNGVFDEEDVTVADGERHSDSDDAIGEDLALDDDAVLDGPAWDPFHLHKVTDVHVDTLKICISFK